MFFFLLLLFVIDLLNKMTMTHRPSMDDQKGLDISLEVTVGKGLSFPWDQGAKILIREFCISDRELGLNMTVVHFFSGVT